MVNIEVDALQLMAKQRGTLIFYEAPHRLQEVLQDMYDALVIDRLRLLGSLLRSLKPFCVVIYHLFAMI